MKKKFSCEVDCANCALKMEEAAKKLDGVQSVSVSFLQQKLTLEAPDDRFQAVLSEVEKVCKRVDPDFSLSK